MNGPTLAFEKLYDDYGLDVGDEVVINHPLYGIFELLTMHSA